MVLLIENLFLSRNFHFKLENHCHHHQHEASLEASLQAFRAYVSISKPEPELKFISLSWIQNRFDYLFDLNKAFAKLVVEIDHPMIMWDFSSIDEYLSYTLRLLDLLNSVKSFLSQVSQARFSMSHALSLIDTSSPSTIQRLRSVDFINFEINLKLEEDVKEKKFSGKDSVIHQALMEMKRNSDLVFGIVLSSLSGHMKPYTEMKKSEESSKGFDAFIEKYTVLKEFEEINKAKDDLLRAIETGKIGENGDEDVKIMERKLEKIQKELDDIGNRVNDLFSEILDGRNEVLDVNKLRMK